MSEAVIAAVASTAWPIATTIIVIVAIVLFRGSLSRLFDRTTRVTGPHGIAIEAAQAERQEIETSKQPETPALPAPAQAGAPALRVPDSNAICDPFDADLKGRLNAVFGDDTELKLAWAIRMRSQALVERMHETHYRLIFSAQIYALRRLNELGHAPLSKGREVYDAAKAQNPEFYKLVTWDSWYKFLVNTGYVVIEPGDDPVAHLTPLGKDFILWMDARGVMEHKQF